MRARRRITAALGAIGLALTVALAGCGDGGSDDASSTAGGAPGFDAPAPAEKNAPEAAGGEPQAAEGQGQDKAAETPDLRVDQRSIVYTGAITVRVDDVNIAAARASGIATAAGGFISGDKRNSGSGSQDATLELRVPAEKFNPVVDQLAKLGKEEQRGINTEDVTEQTIDLDARIATQQARVDSGRKLLAQAKSLSDLVMLEREVATREADLASLQAKKRRLADLTALSTITLVLLNPDAVVAKKEDGPPGFLAGLENGWKGLMTSLGVLLTVLGWLLPWLIAIGLPAWAIIWLYRRYRPARAPRKAPVTGMPAYAMAGPPPGYPASTYPPRPQPQHPSAPQGPAPQPALVPQSPSAQQGSPEQPDTSRQPDSAPRHGSAPQPDSAPPQSSAPQPGSAPPASPAVVQPGTAQPARPDAAAAEESKPEGD